jgi:hypothetical protein
MGQFTGQRTTFESTRASLDRGRISLNIGWIVCSRSAFCLLSNAFPYILSPRELINIYSRSHKCRNVCLSGSWGRSTRVCLIQGFPNSIRLSRSWQLSSTVLRFYTANVLCTWTVKLSINSLKVSLLRCNAVQTSRNLLTPFSRQTMEAERFVLNTR